MPTEENSNSQQLTVTPFDPTSNGAVASRLPQGLDGSDPTASYSDPADPAEAAPLTDSAIP